MTDATRLVWAKAGSPDLPLSLESLFREMPGICAICGHSEPITATADKALGGNFSDRGLIADRNSSRICRACAWCCSGKPPATLRMWTVIAADTDLAPSHPKGWLQDTPGLCLTNRANPHPVATILADPPPGRWLASVAYSGQKHVIPYAVVNRGGGQWTIRVEDHYVTCTPEKWRDIHGHAQSLRRLGIPETAVMDGTPAFIRGREALSLWSSHSAAIAPYLRSPLLQLALWTITKETLK